MEETAMGVELNLLPLLYRDQWLSHEIIYLAKDYDLWERIDALPQKEIPQPISCYLATDGSGEKKYGLILKTPYGKPITYVTASDLLQIDLSEDASWREKAVWAYLAQMPPDRQICLYWF